MRSFVGYTGISLRFVRGRAPNPKPQARTVQKPESAETASYGDETRHVSWWTCQNAKFGMNTFAKDVEPHSTFPLLWSSHLNLFFFPYHFAEKPLFGFRAETVFKLLASLKQLGFYRSHQV